MRSFVISATSFVAVGLFRIWGWKAFVSIIFILKGGNLRQPLKSSRCHEFVWLFFFFRAISPLEGTNRMPCSDHLDTKNDTP